jgi:hypothetical protein
MLSLLKTMLSNQNFKPLEMSGRPRVVLQLPCHNARPITRLKKCEHYMNDVAAVIHVKQRGQSLGVRQLSLSL